MDEHEWSTVKIPKINTAKGQVEFAAKLVKLCALLHQVNNFQAYSPNNNNFYLL